MVTIRQPTPVRSLLLDLERITGLAESERARADQAVIRELRREIGELRRAVAHLRAASAPLPAGLRPVVARAVLSVEKKGLDARPSSA